MRRRRGQGPHLAKRWEPRGCLIVPSGGNHVVFLELRRHSRVTTAEIIGKMKDGALLINTARGSLVNETDVAAALASGKLGGYGADVVSREPIDIHNPLLKAPNCYLTGHSAWATAEARQKIVDVTADSIRGMLEGKPVNVVN